MHCVIMFKRQVQYVTLCNPVILIFWWDSAELATWNQRVDESKAGKCDFEHGGISVWMEARLLGLAVQCDVGHDEEHQAGRERNEQKWFKKIREGACTGTGGPDR
jgi:hypothetical protein